MAFKEIKEGQTHSFKNGCGESAHNRICAENWETKPYTSEHLWNADHHGIPSGKCVKCGKPVDDWNRKLDGIIQSEYGQLHIVKCPVCSGRGCVQKDFYNPYGASTTDGTISEICRSCQGKGYLII